METNRLDSNSGFSKYQLLDTRQVFDSHLEITLDTGLLELMKNICKALTLPQCPAHSSYK